MTVHCLWTAACLVLAAAPDARMDHFGDPLPPGVVARMGTVRFRHGGEVWFVALLPDGKTILSIGKDDVVRWWEAASGKETSHWSAGPSILGCAALSSDRKVLAARVGDDVAVWDALSGHALCRLEKPDAKLLGIACSADGKLVATCGERIRLWEATTGARLGELDRLAETCAAVAFYPDGKTLVSTGRDGRILWWDAESGQAVYEAEGHKGGGTLVAVSPDGKRVATYGFDNTLRVWDAAARAEQSSFAAATAGEAVICLAFSPDGKRLAAGCADHVIRLYDTEAGRELRRCEGHQAAVSAVAFSPGGAILISGGDDGAVRQWDAATGKEIRPFAGPCGQVRALAVSRDGATVASAGIDGRVHLWDPASGVERLALKGGDGDEVAILGFSTDGKTVTAVSRNGKGSVRVWDASDGTVLHTFSPSDMGYPAPFALSPDGAFVAAASGPYRIAVFDAAKREISREYEQDDAKGAMQPGPFLDDGKTLAVFHHAHGLYSTIETLLLWDVGTGGRTSQVLHGDIGNVCACAAAPDGKILAAAGADKSVRLWNIETGEPIRGWEAGKDFILAVSFSADGRTVATTDLDGSISVWEAATGLRRGLLKGNQGFIDALAFSPGGDRLYSGGHDGTVLAWDLTGRVGRPEPAPTDLDDRALARLWDELGGGDAGRAYLAVWTLAAVPDRSVPFLKARLTRPAPTPARIARWIADLDNEDFDTRQKASADLRAADEAAETALNAALAVGPSPEARRRIEELLAWIGKAHTGVHPPDPRVVRAMEALEAAATPVARDALADLADGPETSQTREAIVTLERLRRRPER